MAHAVTTGIDVGTHQVKVIVRGVNTTNNKQLSYVLGVGISESKGLRHGYIIDKEQVTKSIIDALRKAAIMSKTEIRSATISVGGISLESVLSLGTVVQQRLDSEITPSDTDRALRNAEESIAQVHLLNRKILHRIPLAYRIDGKEVLGSPIGLTGGKLEVQGLFITTLSHHLDSLIEAIEEAGIEIDDIVASPIAAATATLTKAQRIAGCVLANIGSETVSIIVYENDIPIGLKVFPIGSIDITNDIALGLQIPLEEAETIKRDSSKRGAYARKKLDDIISARLYDIFELIEAHLKKMGKGGLLPAGIVLTGGGSGITSIEDLARSSLKLPSRIGVITFTVHGSRGDITDPLWTVAYGLAELHAEARAHPYELGTQIKNLTRSGSRVFEWIKKFLP